jgi:membrane protein DedA with SNARE-associated domain
VRVSEHELDRADRWFVKYGPVTVFFTRMMPAIRTFISLPAGIARMPVVKFLIYSAAGSVIWNAGLAYLGYAAGKAAGEDPWGKLQETFHRYNRIFYVVVAVVIVAFAAWVYWRWRRRRDGRPGRSVGTDAAKEAAKLPDGEAVELEKPAQPEEPAESS